LNKFVVSAIVVFCLLVFLTSRGTVSAEEYVQTHIPVALSEAIAMAIKGRPDFSIEIEKERLAQSRVKQARGNFLPTLDYLASSSYVKNYDSFTGMDISAKIIDQDISVTVNKDVPSYQLSDELNFGLNFYAGGRDRALLGEALDNLESARHQKGATLRKIQLEVAKSYWELKKAHIRFIKAKRELEIVRMEMKIAETEYQVNRRSEVEYNAVILKGREKEVTLKTMDRDCLRAFNHYLHVIGMEEKGMAFSSEQIPGLIEDPDNEVNSMEEKLYHPDILRLDMELKAASAREEVAQSENSPKIDLFMKHSFVGRDTSSLWDSWGDNQSENSIIGVKISMNLFNGFRTQERINQAAADVQIKRLQLVEKKKELAEVEYARETALEAANDTLFLALERKKLEEARERVARSQLQSGRVSQLEYKQKVVDVENVADEVMMARIDVALARNALKLMVLE
jgi:outer membrane protein TolC